MGAAGEGNGFRSRALSRQVDGESWCQSTTFSGSREIMVALVASRHSRAVFLFVALGGLRPPSTPNQPIR